MNNLVKYGSLVFLLLAACTRENPVEPEAMVETENPGVAGTLTAIYSPGTRTSYSNSTGVNFSWDAADESIAIMLDDRSTVTGALTRDSEDYTRATVAYTLPSGKTRAFEAFYPESSFDSAETNGSKEGRYIVFPNEYTISDIVAGNGSGSNGRSYNTCNIPMYAVNTEGNDQLLFRHYGDLLRITCNNVPIGTTKIGVSGSSTIAGMFLYSYTSGSYEGLVYEGVAGSESDQILYTVSGGTNGLSSEVDGIVLNVPLPLRGCDYHPANMQNNGFKVTVYDKDNKILRQELLDWYSVSAQSLPGHGYHRTVSLTEVDADGPYLELKFGGGSVTDGTEKAYTQYNATSFLNEFYQQFVYGTSGLAHNNGNTSYPKVSGHPDHIHLKVLQNRCFKINLNGILRSSVPKLQPTKIVVICSPSDNTKILKFASSAYNTNTQLSTIDSSGKATYTNIPSSGFTDLLIQGNSGSAVEVDIFSIRFYF